MFKAIAQAFINAGFNGKLKHNYEFQDGWSANLSYRTYQALKNQGIME